MNPFTMPVIALGAITTAALEFAGVATAAPMGPDVSRTVKSLETQGFQVMFNRTGNAPLERWAVSGVRPGQTFQRMEFEVPGPLGHMGVTTIVTGKTVYLDVAC
jgi:hypothetical protein